MDAFLRRFRRNRSAMGAAAVVLLLGLFALAAPWISPHAIDAAGLSDRARQGLQGSSDRHLLGTDLHGNDVLSLVLHGARTSLGLGLSASLATLIVGMLVGVTTGYFGGWYDAIWMRCIDVVLAFPALLLLILVAASLGPGLDTLFLALVLVGWAPTARVVRSIVMGLKGEEWVLAARAIGATPLRILWRHVLPNCIPSLLVVFSMRVGITLLSVANLNFLGLGSPTHVSWGGMVYDALDYMQSAPLWSLAPATAIALTVLAFNFLGDGLRDALDPKMRDYL